MKNHLTLLFVCLIFTSGCTVNRPSLEEATAEGAVQLSKQNIKDLLTNNELQMVAWDKSVEAMIQFERKGKLTGSNNLGEKTIGRWSADNDNKLCLKFRSWNDNTNRCYKVFKSDDQYLLFYSGVMENRLIPSEDVLDSLDNTNVGIMGSPPPGSSTAASKKTTAPKAVSDPKESSFISAVTFGLLGDDNAEPETPAEEIPFKPEYVPTPMVVVKTLSVPHQQLLDTGDCPGCDLKELDLKGLKLKGANLAGANLQGANLQEANLKGANLKGASLESARLTDAILINADLQGANLSDSNLHWADLTKADLRGANLTRCYMVKAILYKADLTGADFSGAQTQRAIFEKATGVPEHILNRDKGDDL